LESEDLGACPRTQVLEAVGKCSDARHPSLFKPSGALAEE
jgi:hypothetical protein